MNNIGNRILTLEQTIWFLCCQSWALYFCV